MLTEKHLANQEALEAYCNSCAIQGTNSVGEVIYRTHYIELLRELGNHEGILECQVCLDDGKEGKK